MAADRAVGVNAERGAVLLVQFARAPVPGEVKTRMQPQLSAVAACALHTELLLWTCGRLVASGLGPVELSVAGELSHPVFKSCRERGVARLSRQRGTDLGERMYNALAGGLERYDKVLLVGSDCPAIDAAYLAAASQALEEVPVVLGPADDGGYVLVGARRIQRDVFRAIDWGTGVVLEQTLQALAGVGLAYSLLSPLADIDRPEDLALWEQLWSQAQ